MHGHRQHLHQTVVADAEVGGGVLERLRQASRPGKRWVPASDFKMTRVPNRALGYRTQPKVFQRVPEAELEGAVQARES